MDGIRTHQRKAPYHSAHEARQRTRQGTSKPASIYPPCFLAAEQADVARELAAQPVAGHQFRYRYRYWKRFLFFPL